MTVWLCSYCHPENGFGRTRRLNKRYKRKLNSSCDACGKGNMTVYAQEPI